ncbi:MAG TPA: 2OG-Fe(II) oxygenase [Hyphomicrobiaceae bacterium]|nr:2OG-Fe(II) oxygenase [Hyphomicrobiaceae bacterium]
MDQLIQPNATARAFLAALAAAEHVTRPYDYWLFENALPGDICDGIASLPYAPPAAPIHSGRRESNNSTRVYFSPEVQAEHRVCREVADAFRHPMVVRAIEARTRCRAGDGHLRIEYCQDVDGFWLEPHVDIPVKLFTMLIYLSRDPALADAGTDVYDASDKHTLVDSAPYRWNSGMIFIPGKDTWHGFTPRPIRGVRKSIIVNYVSSEWRAKHELA